MNKKGMGTLVIGLILLVVIGLVIYVNMQESPEPPPQTQTNVFDMGFVQVEGEVINAVAKCNLHANPGESCVTGVIIKTPDDGTYPVQWSVECICS